MKDNILASFTDLPVTTGLYTIGIGVNMVVTDVMKGLQC